MKLISALFGAANEQKKYHIGAIIQYLMGLVWRYLATGYWLVETCWLGDGRSIGGWGWWLGWLVEQEGSTKKWKKRL